MLRVDAARIAVERCVPGGESQSLGEYPRDWPPELSGRDSDPFVPPSRGVSGSNVHSRFPVRVSIACTTAHEAVTYMMPSTTSGEPHMAACMS